MKSADRQTARRWIWLIAGIAFLQATLMALTVIPVYLAWRSTTRSLPLLGYAFLIAALGFGLLRWRRPVFPIVLALLVGATMVDQVRRGAYIGLVPGMLYFSAYALGVLMTLQPRPSSTSASPEATIHDAHT